MHVFSGQRHEETHLIATPHSLDSSRIAERLECVASNEQASVDTRRRTDLLLPFMYRSRKLFYTRFPY